MSSSFVEEKLKERLEKAETDLVIAKSLLEREEKLYMEALMENKPQNILSALSYSVERAELKVKEHKETINDCDRKLMDMLKFDNIELNKDVV